MTKLSRLALGERLCVAVLTYLVSATARIIAHRYLSSTSHHEEEVSPGRCDCGSAGRLIRNSGWTGVDSLFFAFCVSLLLTEPLSFARQLNLTVVGM